MLPPRLRAAMMSCTLMSRRIRCILVWRCDLWRVIVCLRLPFCQWFLSVSRLSFSHSVSCLCRSLHHFVSFSFCICISPPPDLYLRPLVSLCLLFFVSCLRFFLSRSVSSSPSWYLPLCLHLRLSSRSLPLCRSLRLFASASVSVCHFVFFHHRCISHLSPKISLRVCQISILYIRSPIFTIYHFALTGRYIIILNLFPCRIVLDIALYMVYAGIDDFPQY
jgi:hypothetical protein